MSFNNNSSRPRVFPQTNTFSNQSVPKQQNYYHNHNPNPRFNSFTPGHGNINNNSYRYNENNSMLLNKGTPKPYNTQTEVQGKSRQKFAQTNSDRMEQEPLIQNENRGIDPFRRFRCHNHNGELLLRLCTHSSCINSPLMCDACILTHNPEHKECLVSLEEFFGEASKLFQTHKETANEYEIAPNDLILFVREEENAVLKYQDHIGKQKKMIEDQFKGLVECFKEMCDVKLNEFKKIFDFQHEVFANNYAYFSQKLRNFYDYVCLDVVCNETYHNKENLLSHFKRLKGVSEANTFFKEMKSFINNIKTFQNHVLNEKRAPKKNIEEEIINEIRKYIQKIQLQLTEPITLDQQDATLEKDGERRSFSDIYNTLSKQIEKAFDTFQANLNKMPVNEDLTKTSFFSLLEDSNFLYQAKSPLKGHNNASVFKQITKSTFIGKVY